MTCNQTGTTQNTSPIGFQVCYNCVRESSPKPNPGLPGLSPGQLALPKALMRNPGTTMENRGGRALGPGDDFGTWIHQSSVVHYGSCLVILAGGPQALFSRNIHSLDCHAGRAHTGAVVPRIPPHGYHQP